MNFFSLFKRNIIYQKKKKTSIDNDNLNKKSLDELFHHYGSDKADIFKKRNSKGHGYSKFYSKYLDNLKNKNINILEIGSYAGASAAAFTQYFPKAKIFCFDINISNFEYQSKKIYVHGIDINNDIGPLKALVGSHSKGKVSNYVIEEESKSELSSHKHKISADVTSKFKEISLPVEIGDIIYISMNLIHSSGENISQKIRFSAQGRYFNTLSKHFPPGRPQFIKSKLY